MSIAQNNLKKHILSMVLLLTLSLAGCGENPQPVTGGDEETNTENANGGGENVSTQGTGEIYYIMEETAIPDPDSAIKPLMGENRLVAYDPVLYGNTVYRDVTSIDEEGAWGDSYIQVLNLADMEWKNIPATNIEVAGKKYSGISILFWSGEKLYVSVYAKEEGIHYLGIMGENGVEEVLCPIPQNLLETMRGRFYGDRAGNFYFFVETMDIHPENGFTYLDNTMNKRQEIKLSGEILDVFEDAEGNLYWYGVKEEGGAIHSFKNDEVLVDGFADINRYEYKAGFSTTGRLYMADTRNIWLVGEETESVFDFMKRDYIINDLYSMEAGEAGDMRFLVRLDGDCTLLTLKESKTPPVSEKQEIVLAFAYEHLALNKAIARFNRQSDKYHVSVLKPEGEESMAEFAERMQLEISVGRGPDMLGHDVIYDITPYVENGYLECLDDVIADESSYLPAALEGCRIDGSLYGIPYDCAFRFAVYPQAFTGGCSSWSMAEMMEAVEASGVKLLQPGCRGMDIVMDYALRDNTDTTYIDWEKGESHLTEKPFLELLAFAKKYADTEDRREETGLLLSEGEAFAVAETMSEMHRMNYLYACFLDNPALIGYPRTEGNGIYVGCRELYVNVNSGCKEGAKEFLRYLISEEAQSKYVLYSVEEDLSNAGAGIQLYGYKADFPVHLGAFQVLLDKTQELDTGEFSRYNTRMDYDVHYLPAPYTEEQEQWFHFLLENAQPAKFHVSAISGMVSEELAPYFAGDITAEQAAEKLDNRVQLYLNERAK